MKKIWIGGMMIGAAASLAMTVSALAQARSVWDGVFTARLAAAPIIIAPIQIFFIKFAPSRFGPLQQTH